MGRDGWLDEPDWDEEADEAYGEYMRQLDEEDERRRAEVPIYTALTEYYMFDVPE